MKKSMVVLVLSLIAIAAAGFVSCGSAPAADSGETFIVSFKGGGDILGLPPEDIKAASGKRIALPGNPFYKKGFQFSGWSDGEKTYDQWQNVSIKQNTEFTAQWKEITDAFYIFEGHEGEWREGEGAPPMDPQDEGGRKFILTKTLGAFIMFIRAPVKLDLSKYNKLHLSVWLDNASVMVDTQFEFATSDWWDESEFYYNLKFHNGWNDIVVPITQALVNGRPSWNDIRFVRFWVQAAPGKTLSVKFSDCYAFN